MVAKRGPPFELDVLSTLASHPCGFLAFPIDTYSDASGFAALLPWLDIDYCPGDKARECTLSLLKALRHAHGLGILHRDIKPHNIGYDRLQGVWKLFDWDLAVVVGVGQTRCVSDSRAPAGTDGYIAPELFEGAPYSAQSDIWGLGRALESKFRYNTDRALAVVLRQMMRQDPAERPSVQDLLDTLTAGQVGETAEAMHRTQQGVRLPVKVQSAQPRQAFGDLTNTEAR